MDKKIQTLEAKQQETVLKISQVVSRTLDLKKILEMASQMTAQALKADRCSIGLLSTKNIYEIVHTYRKKLSYPSIDGAKFNLINYPHIAPSLLKRKAVHIFDPKKTPLSIKEKELFKQLNLKVFLAVPIMVGRKPLGAFHLSRVEESSPFSSSDINLCQTIANQVGIAIENANLLKDLIKDLKSKYEQQNIILNISKSFFQTLNLQELFNLITQKTCEALKMDRCTISTFDPEQKQGVIRSIYLYREAGAFGKYKYASSQLGRKYTMADFPHIDKLLQRKKVFVTEDILSTPLTFRARKYFRDIAIKSTLILPLFSERKMSGVLQVSSIKDYHLFTDSEIKLCQTIANQASLALENAKLMQSLQEKSIKIQQQTNMLEKQFKEKSILLEISKALSQTLDLKRLFEIVTKKTADFLGIDRCVAALISENKRNMFLYTAFSRGKYEPEFQKFQRKLEDFPVMMKQVEDKHIFFTSDISQSNVSSKEKNHFKKLGVKSVLTIPFITKNRILGILGLNILTEQRKFTDSEIKLCQAIANQLSVAIENARLMQDLQEKSIKIQQQTNILEKQFKEERILLEISKALSQTLDLKRLFEIVTKKTADLLRIDRCAAMLIDENKRNRLLYTAFSKGKHEPEIQEVPRRVEDFPVMMNQVEKKHIFCVSDISQSDISSKEKNYFKKIGVKSVLNIPFVLKNRILGILALNTLREQHQFTESEIKLCQAIANQLPVAIENARLMQDLQERNIKIEQQAATLEKQFKEKSILLEISKALSKTLDLKRLFEIVTQKTADLLRIDRCGVVLVDEVKRAAFFVSIYADGRHQPPEESIRGSIEDFPVIFSHLKNKHRFYAPDISQSVLSSKEKKMFKAKGTKSLLVVPLSSIGRFLGLLALSKVKKQHKFTESEIKLSQAIANQLSVAVENARLMELSKKHSKELEKLSLKILSAQEEERKNIAGKLHDVIAQDLTAIQFDLKMCQQTLPEQYAKIKAKLKESEKLATQSLENIRNLTSDLRPPLLDHFGLTSALRWYVNNFRQRTNLNISLKIPELNCKFPPEFETTIYRIIQEGLTNVAKHSKATRVSISLYKKDHNARIIIQDNGIGFDLDNQSFTSGFGLFKSKENAELLGGKFKIISKEGRGTKLDINLPC